MKKAISLILSIALVLGLMVPMASAIEDWTNGPSISMSATSADEDGNLVVSITFRGTTNAALGAVGLSVIYDSDLVAVDTSKGDTFFDTETFENKSYGAEFPACIKDMSWAINPTKNINYAGVACTAISLNGGGTPKGIINDQVIKLFFTLTEKGRAEGGSAVFTLATDNSENFLIADASGNKTLPIPTEPITCAVAIPMSAIAITTAQLPAPAVGNEPVTSFSTDSYTASVSWSPAVSDRFAPTTTYTATVTLTPESGYAFDNGMTVSYDGENQTLSKSGSSVSFTKEFDATTDLEAVSITTAPTAASITYGDKLSSSTLTGGAASVAGNFAWKEPETVPSVSDSGKTFKVVFTPENTGKYATAECDVAVTVNPKTVTPVIADIADQTYAGGNAIEPTITVTAESGALTLVKDTDYTVSYKNNTAVGIGTVTVKAKDGSNYIFTDVGANFNIVAAAGQVTISGNLNVTYGTAVPDVSIDKHGSTGATTVYYYTDEDCTVGETTTKPTAVGSYWVKVKMAADTNYGADESNVLAFTISRANITPSVSIEDWTYGDMASTPSVSGNSGSGAVTYQYKVKDADDSTYTSTAPENAGDYTIKATVEETTNYNSGSATADFKINPKSVTESMIGSVDSQIYTGSEIKPEPTVTDGSALTKGTHFTYTYINNTDAGTNATVTINGQGNYTGTASKTFTINPADYTYTVAGTQNFRTGSGLSAITVAPSAATGVNNESVAGEVKWYSDEAHTTLAVDTDLSSVAADNTKTLYWVFTPAAGQTNYKTDAKSGSTVFTAKDKDDLSDSIVTSAITGLPKTYDGAAAAYTGSATVTGHTDLDQSLVYEWYNSSDTKLDSAPQNAGDYYLKVSIPESNADYMGSAQVNFEISPKGVTITGLSAENKEYDGSTAATVTGTPEISGKVNESDELTVNSGSASFADANAATGKTVTFSGYTLTGAAIDNYTLSAQPASVKANITPKPVTVTGVTATDRAYNGTTTVALTGGTVDVKVGTDDVTVDLTNATGSIESADAADTAKAVTVTGVALAGTAANNYELSAQPTGVTVTISKAAAKTLADITIQQKFTVTTEQTKVIGSAGMPADAGTLSYAKGSETHTGTVTVSWDVNATTGDVKFTLTEGAAGAVVTLPVTITSTNYADSTVKVVITLTEKDPQAALTINSGTTVTYGQTLTLSTTGGSGTGAVSYSVTNGTGEATVSGNVLTPVKAGTVTVTATKASDADYNEVTSEAVTITINKATPTGEPAYTKITTSGKTLADAALDKGTITIPGTIQWVDAEGNSLNETTTVTANTAYRWVFTPDDTANYETLTGSITPYVVHSSSGGSGSSSYSITVESDKNGTVTVSPKSARKGTTVTITVKPDEGFELDTLRVYDKDGNKIKVTEGKNGKYTFTMPASKVTVKAAFEEIESAWPFVDVAEDFWARDAIAWAYENGYMNGNSASTFNPGGSVTRQQLWMILARLSGERPASMAEAKVWAVENGISDGSNPGNAVSRQQMVTILYRYAHLMGYKTSGSAALDIFPDSAKVAPYAQDAMAWSVANGIVGGTTQGTLNPGGTANRAQFATILQRFCKNIVED